MRRRWMKLLPLALLATAGWAGLAAAADKTEAVFPMQEVPTFDVAGNDVMTLGERTQCMKDKHPSIKKLPKLGSASPLYGTFSLGDNPDSQIGFAIDELTGTGRGYNRLYLDVNQDGDLANDKPLNALLKAPKGSIPPGYEKTYKMIFFDPVELQLDCGPGLGKRPIKIQPSLVSSGSYWILSLIPTTSRQGEIEMGGKKYRATLLPQNTLTARYDSPQIKINLEQTDRGGMGESWWGADQLKAIRPVGGTWFTMAVNPAGDHLTVKEYQGEFGLLKTDAGKRNLGKMTMHGSLSAKKAAVPVGTISDTDTWPKAVSEANLPVGDYLPALMTVEMDSLRIEFSDNYHADGSPRGAIGAGRERPYKFAIRKDKPFVLDFSNQPEIIFPSPARDARIKPGETLEVLAVMTDPKLGIMIRGLTDTAKKVEKTFDVGSAQSQRIAQPLSLDPTVVITNSEGKKVSEGVMPFG